MRIVWAASAWEQYTGWNDRRIIRRINLLIKDIQRDPNDGLGKPELLIGRWRGWASRRIDEEHRLIYRVRGDDIEIAACRSHYE